MSVLLQKLEIACIRGISQISLCFRSSGNSCGVARIVSVTDWLQVIKVVSEVSLMVSPVFDFIEISDQVNFIHFSIGKSEWLQVP